MDPSLIRSKTIPGRSEPPNRSFGGPASLRYELVDRYVSVGSENAGRMVTALSSVGDGIATGDEYDVVIVRHAGPPMVEALLERSAEGSEER